MEDGYEKHYLKIIAYHDGKKLAHGVACINIEYNVTNGYHAFIRHLSVIRTELLDQALGLVLDFIWRKIYCDKLRVEVFHVKNTTTGKMAADPVIKAAYNDAKFRWKTLNNDPKTGKRA